MRKTLPMLCFVTLLGLSVPAQAQLRTHAPDQSAPARLYDQGTGFLLNTVFNPEHFRMSHTYEMSVGSFGGDSYSLGMYTNTMAWEFNSKLAARMDVSFAFSPFDNTPGADGQNGRVFLRNAEVLYQPSENVRLHLQVQQNPYGYHMSPYGYYSPYGRAAFSHDRFLRGGLR